MFDTDKSYEINFLGKKKKLGDKYLEAVSEFRFKASKRRYFVSVEHYSFGILGIKYCDINDKGSHNAYTKIFNDHDGFRVIATCIKIMHNLWKNDPSVSFAFYAVPRNVESLLNPNKIDIERYKRARFNIYEHAMINLFPPSNFWKIKDWDNCIYLLINKKNKGVNKMTTKVAEFLLENHEMIFEPAEYKSSQP